MQKEMILTGIKPTGTPHIANYLGAIKPAIEFTNNNEKYDCFYFIADYHALTTIKTKEDMKMYTYEIASTWLACGLDPKKVILYKQSDIPEIFELYTILTNVTPKGLMNRAHAYKSIVDENTKLNVDVDNNVNMGLYNYPILMAADILLFNSDKVPVGLDQKQHIEIARDIAVYFNNRYGNIMKIPDEIIKKEVETIVGLDGRKMSKSYNNTIEMFLPEDKLLKTINKIVTDSSAPDAPKGVDNTIFELYKLFATETETLQFKESLLNGISWGDAKKELFNKMNEVIKPMREKYDYYINNPDVVDEILKNGAKKAKKIAEQNLIQIKKAIGVI